MSRLTEVNGPLAITNNGNLTGVTIASLSSVSGDFTITGNSSLAGLSVVNLTAVGGATFAVQSNPSLPCGDKTQGLINVRCRLNTQPQNTFIQANSGGCIAGGFSDAVCQ